MARDLQARADDLAFVRGLYGINSHRDDAVMRRVFVRFGLDMLSDEALAMLADEYQAGAVSIDVIDAETRAIDEAKLEAALIRQQHRRGAELADAVTDDGALRRGEAA